MGRWGDGEKGEKGERGIHAPCNSQFAIRFSTHHHPARRFAFVCVLEPTGCFCDKFDAATLPVGNLAGVTLVAHRSPIGVDPSSLCLGACHLCEVTGDLGGCSVLGIGFCLVDDGEMGRWGDGPSGKIFLLTTDN